MQTKRDVKIDFINYLCIVDCYRGVFSLSSYPKSKMIIFFALLLFNKITIVSKTFSCGYFS